MKKRISVFIIIVIVFMATCSFGYASEGAIKNSYSGYELVSLFNEVSKKVPQIVRVPTGLYIVGKDLPAGIYTILQNSQVAQNTNNDFSHVAVFSSMEEYNKDPDNLFDENSHALIACNTYWNGFSYELTDGMILFVKMGITGITKHSKNLFAAFWETEDGQAPAVDLSSIISSRRSGEFPTESEETGESNIIVESIDEYTVTRKYAFNDRYGYKCFVIFKHALPVDQNTVVTFTFYDGNNSIIGETKDYVGCTGCNFEYIASGQNNTEYKYVVVSIDSSDMNRTTDCMDGIKVTSSRDGSKIIVTAENIGEKPISLCRIDVLFFDESKNVIDSSFTFLHMPNGEMQKGEIITQEINKFFGEFDSYELFCNALNRGW